MYQEDRSVSHFTRKQRDDRYELNQLRTEPRIPNQDERRVIKTSWSIVSKAAERSSKQRHDTFCDPITEDRSLRRLHRANIIQRDTTRSETYTSGVEKLTGTRNCNREVIIKRTNTKTINIENANRKGQTWRLSG